MRYKNSVSRCEQDFFCTHRHPISHPFRTETTHFHQKNPSPYLRTEKCKHFSSQCRFHQKKIKELSIIPAPPILHNCLIYTFLNIYFFFCNESKKKKKTKQNVIILMNQTSSPSEIKTTYLFSLSCLLTNLKKKQHLLTLAEKTHQQGSSSSEI